MKISQMVITVGEPTGYEEFCWAEVRFNVTQEGNSLAPLVRVSVPASTDGSLPMSEVLETARTQAATILRAAADDLESSSLQELQSRHLG